MLLSEPWHSGVLHGCLLRGSISVYGGGRVITAWLRWTLERNWGEMLVLEARLACGVGRGGMQALPFLLRTEKGCPFLLGKQTDGLTLSSQPVTKERVVRWHGRGRRLLVRQCQSGRDHTVFILCYRPSAECSWVCAGCWAYGSSIPAHVSPNTQKHALHTVGMFLQVCESQMAGMDLGTVNRFQWTLPYLTLSATPGTVPNISSMSAGAVKWEKGHTTLSKSL